MKNKIFAVLALVLITALLIQGCAKKPAPPSELPPEAPAEEIEIEEDLLDIENLEEELGVEELENLDKELEDINW